MSVVVMEKKEILSEFNATVSKLILVASVQKKKKKKKNNLLFPLN